MHQRILKVSWVFWLHLLLGIKSLGWCIKPAEPPSPHTQRGETTRTAICMKLQNRQEI